MGWNSIVITICILLAGFAAWREYQREAKNYLALRLISVGLAIAALACIILPLTYSGETAQTIGAGKILLTDGYNTDSLTGAKDSIYTLSKAIHQQYRKAKLIDGIQDLFQDSAQNTPVHILGYGLDKKDLYQLSNKAITFHPAPAPDGFSAVNWTDKTRMGETFTVQGSFKNISAKAYTLVLKGLNTSLDSLNAPASTDLNFTLTTTPKNAGRLVYTLLAINGKDTMQQEQLPLIIEPTQPLKLLILSASPDFESKFLKTWLSDKGYSVASRSTISKAKFSQEYVNMDQPDLTRITPALLSRFDVLIGDLSLLKSLTPAESSALQNEVMQKGMGVIIRADSSGKAASWLQSGFAVTTVAGKQPAPAKLRINGKSKTTPLTIDPGYLSPQNNIQALVTDDSNHLLAATTLAGTGKLVFSTIDNSHNWMLAGNKDDYAALWSLLISKAARKLPATENWRTDTDIASIDQPATLTLENTLIAGNIRINNIPVYPAQDPAIPFQQVFTYWPSATGWQQVTHQNAAPYWWYTWPANAWRTLKAAKRLSLTAQYAKAHPANLSVTKQIQQKTAVPIPKIYFYILFLMAVTFLWAESKFLAR